MEAWLNRPLELTEVIKCENVALNFYVNAVINYLQSQIQKDKEPSFATIYVPVMNGILKTARKRPDRLLLEGKIRAAYDLAWMAMPAGLQENDLDTIVSLSQFKNPANIQAAIREATARGVCNLRYILAIGNGKELKGIRPVQPKHYAPALPKRKPEAIQQQGEANWQNTLSRLKDQELEDGINGN
jgi:hypothetical protein